MLNRQFLLLLVACFIFSCTSDVPPVTKIDMPAYPETRKELVVDTLFDYAYKDSYRYLEDLESPEIEQWYRDHNDRARLVLDAISGRQGLIDQMKDFDSRRSVRIFNAQYSDTERFFYLKSRPEDETGKLFYRDGFDGAEQLLFDPELYEPESDQTYVISSYHPAPDGKKVAFAVAPNGSESSVLHIMNVDEGSLYPEQIDRCWFPSCSWLPDNESFFFNRLRSDDVHDIDREKDSKVYIHKVGEDPASDIEFFSRENNSDLNILSEEIPILYYDRESDHLLGLSLSVDNRVKAWYAPTSNLEPGAVEWKLLFEKDDDVHDFYSTDTHFYLLTPKDAPNYKILRIPTADPSLSNAEIVVPEFKDRTISGFDLSKDGVFFTTTRNGVEAGFYKKEFDAQTIENIELPAAAGSTNVQTRGFSHPDVWLSISGWTLDGKRYRFNSEDDSFSLEMLSTQAEYPEYENLKVEEVLVESHDGVEVPLSLIYDASLKKDGNNMVLMYGYGSYGISMNPFFSPSFLLWTVHGGVIAIPHVRGGGEKGDGWHKAGQKTNKPNTWKDLIACAEYLIEESYTNSEKIAINGGSAGGILVGRAMTERPDLFAVAIPEVGCLHAIRMEESPNGPVNVPEFGTMSDSVECMALVEMDAYLHLEEGISYPATLVTAGMNDPRVIAWQPGKFAAKLSDCTASEKPILFRADFEAGHGIGDSKTKSFESLADNLGFAFWQMGHLDFQVTEFAAMD